jgi:hypothetical protein
MGLVAPVVAERIRRPMPSGLSVLSGSLPVACFGDPDRASVATLSLNPSWLEFQARSGAWLLGENRRLASLVSLGVADPRDLDDDQVAGVVDESRAYFRGKNWYRAWFGWLESLLRSCGCGSYLDGTACHLDLVQWATKPAQGKLDPAVWRRLVALDRGFLFWQLRNSHVRTVLHNGAGVVRGVRAAGLVTGFDEDVLLYRSAVGQGSVRVFHAVSEGVQFLGWNRPLAGALAADGRRQLSEWLRSALAPGAPDPCTRAAALPGNPTEVALVDGHLVAGLRVPDPAALEALLSRWAASSDRVTIGDVGRFGGSPLLIVQIGADKVVLNRDTKRAAVLAFLAAAEEAGGASRLPWHVTANSRGIINRVSYLPGDAATPGWYAYLRTSAAAPRKLA